MKLFKFGAALILVVVAAIAALANANKINNDFSDDKLSIEDGLRTYKEEVCVDNLGDITCTETTYIECNGEEYKIPVITGYVVHDKIYVPKYVEKIVVEEKKLTGEEKPSPADRIKDSDVTTSASSVRIDIGNTKWRKYIDSNSMDPLIDEGTTTIEIKPKNADEIRVGDIIAYKSSDDYDYAFVHRVVDIGKDEEGIYFTTKGDNYWQKDPKVRFSQVEGIVVGILY